MARAGIFIGVDKTGTLQQLHDAASGAGRMYQWAVSQGMPSGTHAILITDSDGKKVDPDQIYSAIERLIDGPGVEQLIIYFAGHGVNINRSEHWLLSDAPRNPSAAINVSGSVDLARYSGIPHVVFVSDACRVAPEGIQAQNVRGRDIFPNDGIAGKAQPVDQFFACVLGRTAAEIKDPAVAANGYKAIYTGELYAALMGHHPEILERDNGGANVGFYVKPAKLQKHLEMAVPLRLHQLGFAKAVIQDPDAILAMHPYWLSRVDRIPVSLTRRRLPSRATIPPVQFPQSETARSFIKRLIQAAAQEDPLVLQQMLNLDSTQNAETRPITESIQEVASFPNLEDLRTDCTIKVRGAEIAHVLPTSPSRIVERRKEAVSINIGNRRSASILVRFATDVGTIVPAISGFVTTITFDDGELIDISYEPLPSTRRGKDFKRHADVLRFVRAIAAISTRWGRFQLDHDDAAGIEKHMRYANHIDPTLAVYVAYACHDLGLMSDIARISRQLYDDIGTRLFDIALLDRSLRERKMDREIAVASFFPLLARGWPLLAANRVKFPKELEGIEHTLVDSSWSLFDANGLEILQRVILAGGVK